MTASGGTAPFTYALSSTPALPAGLAYSTAGVLSGTPTAVAAAADYTVTATDATGATSSKAFNLTVYAALAAVRSIAVNTYKQLDSASFAPVTATGGSIPLTYAIAPALDVTVGLSMDTATGIISGDIQKAQAAKTYTATIKDAAGATASQTFSLVITGYLAAKQNKPLVVVNAGQAIIAVAPVLGAGGTTPYIYASTPLPSGLTMDPATGFISGTPAAQTATTNYTVTITDGATPALIASNTFTMGVNASLVVTQLIAAKVQAVGSPANFTPVQASGGSTPLHLHDHAHTAGRAQHRPIGGRHHRHCDDGVCGDDLYGACR